MNEYIAPSKLETEILQLQILKAMSVYFHMVH